MLGSGSNMSRHLSYCCVSFANSGRYYSRSALRSLHPHGRSHSFTLFPKTSVHFLLFSPVLGKQSKVVSSRWYFCWSRFRRCGRAARISSPCSGRLCLDTNATHTPTMTVCPAVDTGSVWFFICSLPCPPFALVTLTEVWSNSSVICGNGLETVQSVIFKQ